MKADGSFSEAGSVWPWSCSVALCYKIYSPASVEILRGIGYTTLGTTAATSAIFEETTAALDPFVFETTPPDPFELFETTPAPQFDFLLESTPSNFDIFETSESLGKISTLVFH